MQHFEPSEINESCVCVPNLHTNPSASISFGAFLILVPPPTCVSLASLVSVGAL